MENCVVGYVNSIESMATLDGDGIRYAIFLSGCPLRCVYCHNPDTWNTTGTQTFTAQQLYKKIYKYIPYFASNGGVTFSGGEPLLQSAFIAELIPLLQKDNINFVIDTSGAIAINNTVTACVAAAELIILDIKFYDIPTYSRYTNGDFNQVLEFCDLLCKLKKRVWLRTVIIPHINDNETAILKYANIAKRWDNIEKYELLAFHTMGFSKYEKLGISNPLQNTLALPPEKLIFLQTFLNEQLK